MMWLFFACSSNQEGGEVTNDYSDPLRLLRRWSLDIRGTLPSMEEIESIRTEPARLDAMLDTMLDDPLWEESLVHSLNEQWHTRVNLFSVVPDEFYTGDYGSWYDFNRSVGDEPLRLMAHIATNDLAWSEVVLADYSFANERLASMYPTDYPEGESGWQKIHYLDGRPPVGVLATNGLWWRYITDSLNMNRMRAATMMRLLLCDDLLARPISFEASSHALEDPTSALQQDLACLNCHASLDPLASALFGFYWLEEGNPLEAVAYHPERELLGEQYIGVSPGWYGTPVHSLAELGLAISQDPRFHQCTTQNFAEIYLRRKMSTLDHGMLQEHVAAFLDGEQRIKALVRNILTSDEYTNRILIEGARTLRMMTPHQLEVSLQTWNSHQWKNTHGPLLDNDYRSMVGGVDGLSTYAPQLYPSTTTALTIMRYAQFTGMMIVEDGLHLETGMLRHVDESTTPSEASFVAQLNHLRLQLHGIEPTEEWRSDITDLWTTCTDTDSSKLGWTCVLSAMIQDIDFVSY